MNLEKHGARVTDSRPFIARDRLSGAARDRADQVDEIARSAVERFERRIEEVTDAAIDRKFAKFAADDDSPESEKWSNFVVRAARSEVERAVAEALQQFAERNRSAPGVVGLEWKEASGFGSDQKKTDTASITVPDSPEFWRQQAAIGYNRRHRPFTIERAITAEGTAVTGGEESSLPIFASWSAANEFAGLVPVRPVTADTFNVNQLGAVTFAEEATVNPSARTESGTLASNNVALKTYIAQTSVSLGQEATIPGIRAEISEEMMRQSGSLAGTLIAAAIKASVNSSDTDSIASVNSEVAAGPPVKASVYARILDMLENLEAAYRMGATWINARKMERRILEAESTSDFVVDPVSGLRIMSGIPSIVGDHLAAAAANDLMSVVGRFSQGAVLGWGSPMIISQVMLEYAPGKATFFGHVRYAAAVRDAKALVGMQAAVT